MYILFKVHCENGVIGKMLWHCVCFNPSEPYNAFRQMVRSEANFKPATVEGISGLLNVEQNEFWYWQIATQVY